MSRKMFFCLQIVGCFVLVFSIAYLIHPATGPFDYAAGKYRSEWTPGLIAGGIGGVIGGVIAGRLVKRMAAKP